MVVLKVVALLMVVAVRLVWGRTGEVCFPFGQANTNEGPPAEVIQGRPGKRGGIGAKGPKGDRGVPGPPGGCACDPTEVEQLRSQIEMLNDTLTEVLRVPSAKVVTCPIGLKNGRVPDSDMSASSSYDHNHGPAQARLDILAGPGRPAGAWVGGPQSPRAGEWIQVDLRTPTTITGVVTQGRANSQQWVTTFKISYGISTSSMQLVQRPTVGDMIFQGNRDENTHVINKFPQPVSARYIRLIVQAWHNYPSLRMEYLTC